MREKLAVIIRRLAERYASHPALGGWHVSNEYNGACYCGLCRKEFVDFLKQRYGSLERLNEVYWSAFWGHRYSAWEQVDPNDRSMDLARVDFLRFNTQQVVDFMRFEVEALRDFSDAPVTTNMMGVYEGLDYWRIADVCDFIADRLLSHVVQRGNGTDRRTVFHDSRHALFDEGQAVPDDGVLSRHPELQALLQNAPAVGVRA